MAFPDQPVYTHLPTSGLPHYPAGYLLLSEIIAILRFIIHFSPLDCKLNEKREFNPNLLLGS